MRLVCSDVVPAPSVILRVVVLAVLGGACASASPAATSGATSSAASGATSSTTGAASRASTVTHPPPAGLVTETGSPNVVAWVSSPWSFSTTSYAIIGKDGLILVDTQFLPKETVQFVEDVERATGKKAVAAFVLHANPDKFNGTAALQARGVRVMTSTAVAALIPEVHKKRVRAFAARYQPDYPTEQPAPETFEIHAPATSTTMDVAGTTVTLHAAGPGCSEAHVILQHGDDVFAGDLVANGAHAWLEIGQTLEWQRRLDEMAALTPRPRRVHPGRGLSGGPELLDVQRRYLDDVIAAVAAERPSGEPSEEAIARAKAAIVAKHPGLRFAVFLEIGLPAEWRRQAKLTTTKTSRLDPEVP